MFPSSTNSSTLSESACSALDRPSKSPDCRPETAPSLPQDDSNRCARRRGAFRLRAGFVCDEAFLADCFFLTDFFGRFACLRDAFFARFPVPILDAVLFLLLLLFFLEGMTAVYHRDYRRDDACRKSTAEQRVLPLTASGRVHLELSQLFGTSTFASIKLELGDQSMEFHRHLGEFVRCLLRFLCAEGSSMSGFRNAFNVPGNLC